MQSHIAITPSRSELIAQTRGLINMVLLMVVLSSVPFGIGTTFSELLVPVRQLLGNKAHNASLATT